MPKLIINALVITAAQIQKVDTRVKLWEKFLCKILDPTQQNMEKNNIIL